MSVVNRKADHYHRNYECLHSSDGMTNSSDGMTNSRRAEYEREVEGKIKSVHQEKIKVVIISVIASCGLMILKFSIGALTNSLGIFSEGMNSGLDLIAALVTLYAICMVLRPSDLSYTYGYGKFESLSSLAQIVLLLVVASWVTYEAMNRIFFENIRPEISIFSILIMFVSIGIDYGRSRALYRAARKFDSQALEADGLHFRADMFSSAIVVVGLLIVLLFDIPDADAYAALGVAAVILYASLGLGRRTLGVLLDKAPKGIYWEVIQAVSDLEGVTRPHNIRIRNIGSETLVEMHIEVPRTFTHDRAHKVATSVEQKIEHILPSSKVLVHVDATESANETIFDKIRLIAAETEGIRNVHSLHVSRISSPLSALAGSPLDSPQKRSYDATLNLEEKKSQYVTNEPLLHLYMDVQMRPSLDLNTAHSIVDSFEEKLKKEVPQIEDVTTHIEIESSVEDLRMAGTEKRVDPELLMKIKEVMQSIEEVLDFKDIRVFDDVTEGQHITLTICLTSKSGSVATSLTLEAAHKIATKVQNMIINITEATRVVVHTETNS
ncbi:MAG: cation diffusion facilitator family transporter [Nitrososphaeraceae archaeon]|jgi:cation diffusion facilitator family transporter